MKHWARENKHACHLYSLASSQYFLYIRCIVWGRMFCGERVISWRHVVWTVFERTVTGRVVYKVLDFWRLRRIHERDKEKKGIFMIRVSQLVSYKFLSKRLLLKITPCLGSKSVVEKDFYQTYNWKMKEPLTVDIKNIYIYIYIFAHVFGTVFSRISRRPCPNQHAPSFLT